MDYFCSNVNDFNEKVYMTTVCVKPGLDSAWLGAEVLTIDNIPIKQYLQDSIFPYVSASTKQHKWMQGAYKIAYNYKSSPFNATIRKTNGEIESISLIRNGEETRTDDEKYAGAAMKFPNKLIDFYFTQDSIGVLNVNGFGSYERVRDGIWAYLNDIKKAKALIIDLRYNGGGNTMSAWLLQSLLTPPKVDHLLNFAWETRINNGVKKANSNWKPEYKDYYNNSAVEYNAPDTIKINDSIPRITRNVAILAGRYTFSAAEDFLINIYEVPNRPVIIGEETGGSTGSPLVVPLSGNSYARICTRRVCYPYSGKRFVGTGVQPDITIKQTIDDYMNGNDVVLEAGLKYLREKH
jgi:C-terminal processing protease CtpA/Prc